ncbi:UNVERIFIED_CONTAM: hypothetical protein FKN15_017010 [Acipenser sinensis]
MLPLLVVAMEAEPAGILPLLVVVMEAEPAGMIPLLVVVGPGGGHGGITGTPPFFVAGSSLFCGSRHTLSCCESAAGGAGLLTSPPSSWPAVPLRGAPAT